MTASPAAPRPAPHSARRNHGVAATRWLASGSLLALIALCLAWELVLAPLRPGGSWLALKALALCLPLAGLLKNRMYTYRWVSLVIWLYFTEGVVRGWGDRPPSQWLAWGEAALCLVLFAACAAHVRLRQRHHSPVAPARSPAETPERATPPAH
ncbi:DUF2069 domain-containing protein [Verminephrobacter eiseniae]|uniref:DUF2069 domain-containing protein n=2 Tax=Verminephrobacter eiseniae TaxID=364317 RepID=UPI0010EC6D66|nr:DUF2069 domain-containing protein [Verminephrobacter eiseniae]KAB7631567.1 DUF2069 domain-containing protein [Verminephrobacter sp. Larva24]MCW5231070.1 DUF2069 domain-containing protein [Verminephrobacter eiseniae]MCW5292802.1 DUF2069 domain-containing protein [Verminephrobacter eiseniae]MCW8224508.1 DUF2069 domain-containing protein [Verminephrobacter eiseniae]MCW8235587.1 DUF2069 domain-containing protein [Verminephrobacter eiseniae]